MWRKTFRKMKTIIQIEVETEFGEFKDEDKDSITEDIEKTFHNKLYEVIEGYLADGDDEYLEEVIEEVNDEWDLKIKEVNDLGKLNLKISQEEIK